MSRHLRFANLAVLFLFAFVVPSAFAEKTLRVPEDHETIMAAVEASEWGDTILVGPGIYQEFLVFTKDKGDGLIVRSVAGPEETTLRYEAKDNDNEAVAVYQRCTNSTQLIGFKLDGMKEARRAILCNSNSDPVFSDLVIEGVEYGVASHKESRPYLQNVTATGCVTAAVFVSGGSADIKNSRIADGGKFGIYVNGGSSLVRIRNCEFTNNGQVGIQISESEAEITECRVIGNGDTGIILQDSSPVLQSLIVKDHPNIGIVLEVSSAELYDSTIEGNGFGVVSSIEGEPKIMRNTFRNNNQNHLGVEGDANPLIGGSIEEANQFLGDTELAVQSSTTAVVDATFNFWDTPCVPQELFEVTAGDLVRKPWVSANLKRSFSKCGEARKYHEKWLEGRVDEDGNVIRKGTS